MQHCTQWLNMQWLNCTMCPPLQLLRAMLHRCLIMSKSDRFRTRKHQNDNISSASILMFSRSKRLDFDKSSHSEMSRGVVLFTWSVLTFCILNACDFDLILWSICEISRDIDNKLNDLHFSSAVLGKPSCEMIGTVRHTVEPHFPCVNFKQFRLQTTR